VQHPAYNRYRNNKLQLFKTKTRNTRYGKKTPTMSSLANSKWLLGVGAAYALSGLAAHIVPRQYLSLWGAEVDSAVIATSQMLGAFAASLGGWFIYAGLGDEDEQKHANRIGLFNSLLLGIFWARGGLPYGNRNASLGLAGVLGLGFGYFNHRLQ
jgi:hypothetical protein